MGGWAGARDDAVDLAVGTGLDVGIWGGFCCHGFLGLE